MAKSVTTGLAKLRQDKNLQNKFNGNIALLCHSASIDIDFKHSLEIFLEIFGDKVKKVFGPQHGFVTDVQDNMIESDHYTHPHFNLPIYSLYSETRIPTDKMLEGIDYLFVDLQDVGTRIYTYIYTMTYVLEACAKHDIEVVILDRPNPIDAKTIEGNILEPDFSSFVGRHPIPVRHGLTIAEVAKMHQNFWAKEKCKLSIIEMENYKRDMYFEDTRLPWVMPSPNLPTIEGCFTFVGTVLFEGTNISEGRGTTRPLELIGHPDINPWEFKEHIDSITKIENLNGFTLRAINFMPTFQKHQNTACGGLFIHVTDRGQFKPWRLNQIICKELFHLLKEKFSYKQDPYEYEEKMNACDMINGTDKLRFWYELNGPNSFLDEIEQSQMKDYLEKRKTSIIYS